jgi:DNA-directed RNA polymerase subunit M/transcription elongation factor TFIIS
MAKFCKRCGKKLSFFEGRGSESLCKDCKKAIEEEIKEQKRIRYEKRISIADEIAKNNDITKEQIEILKDYKKEKILDTFDYIYRQFTEDKELSEKEFNTLDKFADSFNLTKEDIGFNEKIRPYVFIYNIKEKNELPETKLAANGFNVILKKGEKIHHGDSATLKELKTVSLGYSGGSKGVSIRIMKGVSYRVGGHRGNIIKEDVLKETSRGVLLITNQRLFLNPFGGFKPLSIPLNKILSYQIYENVIEVYKEGREKSYLFQINDSSSVEIFGICLSFLLSGVS